MQQLVYNIYLVDFLIVHKIPHFKTYFPIVVYKTGRRKECLCSTSNNTKEHFPKKKFLVLFFIRKLNIVGKDNIQHGF